MTLQRISSGGPWEEKAAYCRAVVAGGWVHVAGTTGADPETGEMPESVVDQCRNTLAKIEAALAEAGSSFADAVRVHYILPDAADFEHCFPVLREAFGANPPAATMIAAGLIAPGMKIEIELTCFKG